MSDGKIFPVPLLERLVEAQHRAQQDVLEQCRSMR